jgi:predicted RNase H-like HicB family nuclease
LPETQLERKFDQDRLCSKGSELASRNLRCYAEGRDGDWEAICLDLDIAVQGSSFEEVFSSLQKAISLYLDSVTELPPQERQALLRRPAPFPVRVRFLTHVLRGLFADSDGDRQRHQFTMSLAA